MMHFGNGDKPNRQTGRAPVSVSLSGIRTSWVINFEEMGKKVDVQICGCHNW